MEMNPTWRYFEPPPEEKQFWEELLYWAWDPVHKQGLWVYRDGHEEKSIISFVTGSRGWIEIYPDPDLQMDIGL